MRLLTVPKGQSAFNYTSLAIDEASNTLIGGRDDGVVDLWDLKRLLDVAKLETPDFKTIVGLSPIISLDIHTAFPVTSVKVYETFIISSDDKGNVYKTSINNKHESSQIFKHTTAINDIEIFHDIALFAASSKVLALNLKTSTQLTPILTRSDVRSMSIDPTNNYLVFIAFNRTVSVCQIQYSNDDLVVKKLPNAARNLQSINSVAKFSWSPVGDKYIIPNADLDPSVSSIGVISRSTWKNEFSLIGHNCNVARFSPQLIIEGSKFVNIIASSGIDKSVAVWNTTFQRPLFTATEASTSPIQDLIWTPDGLGLIVASDSLSIFVMEQAELGTKVPDQIVEDLRSKLKKVDLIPVKPPVRIEESPKQLEPKQKTPTPIPTTQAATVPITNGHELERDGEVQTLAPSIVKNGKKRIAPTLVSSNNKVVAPIIPTSDTSKTGLTTMEFDAPSYSVPKDLKRKEETIDPDSQQPPLKKKRDVETVEFIGSIAINPSSSFAKIRVSTPKIRSSFLLESPNDETLTLEVRNGSGNEQKPTKITLLKNSRQVFVEFLPKLMGLATGGEGFFWAVSSVDGILYVFSDSGRRIFPPIVLGTPLSFLESKGRYLLAVTSIGEVYGWDVIEKKALFEPSSLYPLLARSNPDLLTRAENLTLCSISSTGVPIVTVSNGNGYLFDKDMGSWTLISDSWWAFGSQYWDSRGSKGNGTIVNLLEKKTNDEIVRRGRGKFLQKMAKTMLMKEGYENLEKTISLAHLENRILISQKLGEYVDFKSYLIIYCRRISEMGYKAKLHEIFDELLGPQVKLSQEQNKPWDSKILTYDKHELLKELVFACANIRGVQRTLVQFATALNILDQVSF